MSGYQGARNALVTLGATTSTQVCNEVSGDMKRTQLIIANTSAAASVTIIKGDTAIGTASAGIVLLPNGIFVEATDGGYECWQGAVQAYATAAGQLSIVEGLVSLTSIGGTPR